MDESFAEVNFTDGDFCWRLRHLGLLFDADNVVLKSRPFQVFLDHNDDSARPDGQQDVDPSSRWQLRATCRRQCPESMLRVNVSLANLNETAESGRFSIRSYYNDGDLDRQAGFDDDETLRRDLSEVAPGEESEGVFIGWAGAPTNFVTKIVHAKVRIFRYNTDGERVKLPIQIPTDLPVQIRDQGPVLMLDERMQQFVSMLYLRLMENIKLQLKQRRLLEVEVADIGTQTHEEEEKQPQVDWEEVSRRIFLRVVEVIYNYNALKKKEAFIPVEYGINPCTSD